MKIAIDVSPLQSGHKVRGVGFYLSYLKKALLEYYPSNEYLFFEQETEIDNSVDVVHYPYFDPFFLTLPFAKRHKTVVTVHDVTPLVFSEHFPAGIKGKLRWQMQRFNLQRVDGILTDSEISKKDIEKITGISSQKISVAYLAAGEEFRKFNRDDPSLKAIKKKYNLPEEFVLYVGDITWNKNVPRLLEALQKVAIPLFMVGKSLVATNFDRENRWNSDLIEVQRVAARNKNVHLLGFIPTEDLVRLYNLASVFVFPSVYEGFGLPIIEAMQSGCPVIISHEGCMPEVGGDAVAYFDGYQTESLINSLKKVLNSQKLQKELSEKGLEQAKKFSWKKTAEKTIEAYKKVVTI
ncbi:MAG TPA: glycosyltransferase family 1 protein [Candidatus Sulfotelmatobacter sp.]|jgi:glycosyltransferase involved in cell wall biosynthesis|nr:glycosyltransferase family 1 protein [Candidatus Sulfotelmatobacter sp.]